MATQEVVGIPIVLLRRDGGTQLRARIDREHVADLVELLRLGTRLDPIDVMFDGKERWVWDGFHRIEAHLDAAQSMIYCRVTNGSQRDAVLAAAAANKQHLGLKRDRESLKKSVKAVLYDVEWSTWSDGKIAGHIGVTTRYVGEIRTRLEHQLGTAAPPRREGRDGKTRDVSRQQQAQRERDRPSVLSRPVDLSEPPPGYMSKGSSKGQSKPSFASGKGSVLGVFAPGRERVTFSDEVQYDPEESEVGRPCPHCGGTGILGGA